MSSRIGSDINTDEIVNYLEKLKQEKKITDQNLTTLEREKTMLEDQIEELEKRRDEVYARFNREREIVTKQEQAIKKAESAYFQIVESSRSLADYLRREFKESRKE
ncbi:unnamed protein product [Auanema sp. JU1783]|nr:unnamed protein product [Auanema sp. JU1783]